MKAIIKSIDLQTEIGTFTFTKHFNSPNTNAYDGMVCFESNNWEQLGDTAYHVVLLWEDDTNSTETFTGINASANLAEFVEGL